MASDAQPRLAVILHADVVGSTTLVRQDERVAHQRIQAAFRDVGSHVKRYGGTVTEIRGDALVAEFARASDAVLAALAAQQSNRARPAGLQDGVALELRMGIALGEVVITDATVTGAGVVLAQRLEQLAEPGGICISGAVREAVPERLSLSFEPLGKREVKGFEEPVAAFAASLPPNAMVPPPEPAGRMRPCPGRVRRGWLAAATVVALSAAALAWLGPWRSEFEPASTDKMAFPLPDLPSIAVLPFDSFSNDQRDDLVAKGFTEDLITALARIPGLFVISRVSSFAFKDKPAPATEIAEELGVRYLLEGSIQRSGETLRINAQLIDALKGHHLWADRFDGKPTDLFELQDDIVRRILVELRLKLSLGDYARLDAKGTKNLEAWLLRQEALEHLFKFTRDSTRKTRELCQRAHELDPDWARPLACLAFCNWFEARRGWTENHDESVRRGFELASRAVDADPDDPVGYMMLGNLYNHTGDFEKALQFREKAIEVAPFDFVAHFGLAGVLDAVGESQRAVEIMRRAERLSPRHAPSFDWGFAFYLLNAGDYEAALSRVDMAIARMPQHPHPRFLRTAILAAMGREADARRSAKELLEIKPDASASKWLSGLRKTKDPSKNAWIGELLVEAGVPG